MSNFRSPSNASSKLIGGITLTAPERARDFPPPDLKDKIRRAIWSTINRTIYRIIPTRIFGPRRLLLRLFGAKVASDALPYPGVLVWAPWNLEMGPNSCLANGVNCYNVATISIGAHVTVSQGAYLCTPSHDFRRPNFPLIAAEIRLKSGVWVSTEAFLGPGVTINENAVVGARAVVNKSVPRGVVVAGNPARVIAAVSNLEDG